MPASNRNSLPAIGFLTIIEQSQQGFFGGYLLLNTAGRPLEFHCTAPIKPNRAQEILYGPTLEPYLFGERIGKTLLEKASVQPLVICTDVAAALSARDFVEVPVVLVNVNAVRIASGTSPHPESPKLISFGLGTQKLAIRQERAADQQETLTSLAKYADALDLAEPFERIRQAVDEAKQTGKKDRGSAAA